MTTLRPEYGPDFFKNLKPNRFAGVTFAPPIDLDKDVAETEDDGGRIGIAPGDGSF